VGNAYKISARKPEGKIPFNNLSMDGRIILKWISNSGSKILH
jgi:hypothetical protein